MTINVADPIPKDYAEGEIAVYVATYLIGQWAPSVFVDVVNSLVASVTEIWGSYTNWLDRLWPLMMEIGGDTEQGSFELVDRPLAAAPSETVLNDTFNKAVARLVMIELKDWAESQ